MSVPPGLECAPRGWGVPPGIECAPLFVHVYCVCLSQCASQSFHADFYYLYRDELKKVWLTLALSLKLEIMIQAGFSFLSLSKNGDN